MWRKRYERKLVEPQKKSVEVPQKARHKSTIQLSDITPGHMLKGLQTLLQIFIIHFYRCSIHNSQEIETT